MWPLIKPSLDWLMRNRTHASRPPALLARCGRRWVPCRGIVAGCRTVRTMAELSRPASEVAVLLEDERGQATRHAVTREGTHLRADLPAPRRSGEWAVCWVAAGREVARLPLGVVTPRAFREPLRVTRAEYVIDAPDGPALVSSPRGHPRVGPCFEVIGLEGVAGRVRLEVRAVTEGAPRVLWEEGVVLGAGPVLLLPGTAEAAGVRGFELACGGRVLVRLPVSAQPEATFTAEGCYAPSEDFAWTAAADEEMARRLEELTGPLSGK